ncbi:hypothetical protein GWN42_30745 [candidate division KSB1 bacterium]|nr:hypothetical protein [candidate division KSB1 bacterium]
MTDPYGIDESTVLETLLRFEFIPHFREDPIHVTSHFKGPKNGGAEFMGASSFVFFEIVFPKPYPVLHGRLFVLTYINADTGESHADYMKVQYMQGSMKFNTKVNYTTTWRHELRRAVGMYIGLARAKVKLYPDNEGFDSSIGWKKACAEIDAMNKVLRDHARMRFLAYEKVQSDNARLGITSGDKEAGAKAVRQWAGTTDAILIPTFQ